MVHSNSGWPPRAGRNHLASAIHSLQWGSAWNQEWVSPCEEKVSRRPQQPLSLSWTPTVFTTYESTDLIGPVPSLGGCLEFQRLHDSRNGAHLICTLCGPSCHCAILKLELLFQGPIATAPLHPSGSAIIASRSHTAVHHLPAELLQLPVT